MISPPRRYLAIAAMCTALAGCASDEPIAYSGVASSAYMAPDANDRTGRTPYRYSTQVNWRQYDKVMIEPVVIYQGSDHQFGEMTAEDKEALARDMQEQFTQNLTRRFIIVRHPGPNTLRLTLTLTGATANTPGLATLSRFDVAGAVYNGMQTIRDGEGAFTGAVRYAVEIHDAHSNKLLAAFIAKQYPKPYDLPAGVGPLAAAQVGIKRGAEELVAQLQ